MNNRKEYTDRNKAWLIEKAQEPGVKALDGGIFYKVLKSGNKDGRKPNRGSVVMVHYTGKTINGKTFDSSRGGVAPAFRLRELIPGVDICPTANARRRQVGGIYSCRNGLREVQPARYPRRLHPNL